MFSSKARYALKAVLLLAQEEAVPEGEGPISIRDLAEMGGLPRPFLAKIMQELSASGVIKSRKGPGGGVSLATAAQQRHDCGCDFCGGSCGGIPALHAGRPPLQ